MYTQLQNEQLFELAKAQQAELQAVAEHQRRLHGRFEAKPTRSLLARLNGALQAANLRLRMRPQATA
jgi:hypothetical protein